MTPITLFVGDSSLSQGVLHGNAKKSNARPRIPLLPSLARQVEASSLKPAELYNNLKMSATSAEEQRSNVPSSKEQVKELKKNYRRLSGRDDIESILLRLSKEYRGFYLYVASPRVVLVLAEPLMVEHGRKILQTVSWSRGKCI